HKQVATHELRTAGAPKALRLTPDATKLKADGQDLSQITVEVVDAKGVLVPTAAHHMNFEVIGHGTTAAVDNGDNLSDEPFTGNDRTAYRGRALLIVRANRDPGQITIKATAEGLTPATLKLRSTK